MGGRGLNPRRWTGRLLSVREGRDARELLALEELEGGAAARGDEGHLVLGVVLYAAGGGVTPPDDGENPLSGRLDHRVHHALGARLERCHLKHAHGAVPDDRLATHDDLGVLLDRDRAAVEAHHAGGDAARLVGRLDLAVLAELARDHKVLGENDLDPLGLGHLHDLGDDGGARLVIEGGTDLHLVEDLEESVGHAASDDHLVNLGDEVLDELDLVRHLGASQDGEHGAVGVVQDLAKVVELLGHQEASALGVVALADHRRVGAVGGAEGVRDVDVGELAERGAELLDLGGVGLDLLAVDLGLALLLDVEADVLEQDDRAGGGVRARLLDGITAAVLEHGDILLDELAEGLGDGLERELVLLLAVGAAEVGREHDRLGALVKAVLDRGDRALDAGRVGDDGGVLLVLGDVEVDADEDALAADVHVLELELLEGRHA
mmetsp:Transcript_22814/g.57099  ORF Transcript_22814/g.57099 Transcript_22814/m.57099 type:complete len:436 (-) Transcript_22814:26-1333(-)